jgi:hypothetical protein
MRSGLVSSPVEEVFWRIDGPARFARTKALLPLVGSGLLLVILKAAPGFYYAWGFLLAGALLVALLPWPNERRFAALTRWNTLVASIFGAVATLTTLWRNNPGDHVGGRLALSLLFFVPVFLFLWKHRPQTRGR